MFYFSVSLSAQFAKEKKIICLTFTVEKRTCLLSVHFLLTLQREEIIC